MPSNPVTGLAASASLVPTEVFGEALVLGTQICVLLLVALVARVGLADILLEPRDALAELGVLVDRGVVVALRDGLTPAKDQDTQAAQCDQ